MLPDDLELRAAIDFRRRLHRFPELSGEERETAEAVAGQLAAYRPDRLLRGLGGHGVAAVFDAPQPGLTVLFRCELDALPIREIGEVPHRSRVEGKGHLCGHDGHAAILTVVAALLARQRPQRGRVVLLFQPAEETGAGAAAVIADPAFAAISPDYAFSLHNWPGLPLGQVALREGPVNCASRGMRIALAGRTAHASMPADGLSPMSAMARLMPALTALGTGGALGEAFRLVTVTHARLGEPAFGVAPGAGEIWATLRTLRDAAMDGLVAAAEELVAAEARAAGLGHAVAYEDVFRHCENHPEAVAVLRAALDAEGVRHQPGEPMYPSEDFGRFAAVSRSAMFFLGAGTDHPRLHNPDYDFPDELIPVGARVFLRTVRDLLG
ncbi:amidohydrolase [Aureimonas leprariae]|uniref:Amidohydrolase n=1 Tax=Plantimonas leprariae TaxID=2615207 RepID=A0A7V7PLP3_9HYPH|nr:amidohydrolase [Aureimonas leprariae]KAB0677388.1 amidohydrolase [Aureimonas leprariae]